MLGLGKSKPIEEHEAEGDTERVYHEIRQTLRVTGVNLVFRTWAGYQKFLPAVWDAVRPNCETRAFEEAADRVRAQAVHSMAGFQRLDVPRRVRLGESQAYQVQAALLLYHYINPKLLVLVCAVRNALSGETVGGAAGNAPVELIERGAPPAMYSMEMVGEEPDDKGLRDLFDDMKKIMSLPSINSDYRTLALWPDYLHSSWSGLRHVVETPEYRRAAHALHETALELVRTLPYPITFTRKRVEDLGEHADDVVKTTTQFERILPSLILNIAFLALDWKSADQLEASPFPPMARAALRVRKGGAR